jgi:ribonuclease VapC
VIVDTSALIAIVVREDGWEPLVDALERSRRTRISVMTLLELRIVLAAGLKRGDLAEELLRRYRIEPIDFTVEQSAEAAQAHQKYGRGNHPAGLNFGDCAAYATAKLAGEPLLYVGNDFAQTDVVSALG